MLSVALLGGLALNAAGAPIETMDAQGQRAASLTWLTLENGLLCRTWSTSLAASAANIPPVVMSSTADAVPLSFTAQRSQSGLKTEGTTFAQSALAQGGAQETQRNVKHCASQWHISADGRLISDASGWVPNPTGEWPALSDMALKATPLRAQAPKLALAGAASQASQAPVNTISTNKIASVLVIHTIPPKPVASVTHASAPAATFYTSPGGIGAWNPVPGHATYTMYDFAGDPHSSEFGVCTWWAWYARRDEPQLGNLGAATNWINGARALGMSVGDTPAVGATVVFQPGVQGAGGGGHVGHVEQLVGGGWFIISEMNFYWNGGGWGRVDYRYAHVGSGVAFIY